MTNGPRPGGNLPRKNRLQNSKRLTQKELRRISGPFRGAARQYGKRRFIVNGLLEKGYVDSPIYAPARHAQQNTSHSQYVQ